MTEPRAYTSEEIRDMIVGHAAHVARYWATLEGPQSVQERCDGVAFSLLAMLDGCSMNLPRFMLTPDPHEDDKEWFQRNGEDWFEPVAIDCNFHEYFKGLEG